MEENTARVVLEISYDERQLAAARQLAASLDAMNIGSDDPPESYSPSLAFARVLATDNRIVAILLPEYSSGYTAEPMDAGDGDTYEVS